MSYIDYYGFKIYKTYLLANKIAPWLFTTPLFQAASIAAMYPILLLFSFSVYLGIWNHLNNGVWQFITVLFLMSAFAFLSILFEARIKKYYPHYIKESKRQCMLGSFAVNVVIVLCIIVSIGLLM